VFFSKICLQLRRVVENSLNEVKIAGNSRISYTAFILPRLVDLLGTFNSEF